MTDLVGNPEDRFSHDEAGIVFNIMPVELYQCSTRMEHIVVKGNFVGSILEHQSLLFSSTAQSAKELL